jgi:hypothetical protein
MAQNGEQADGKGAKKWHAEFEFRRLLDKKWLRIKRPVLAVPSPIRWTGAPA